MKGYSIMTNTDNKLMDTDEKDGNGYVNVG